MDRFVDSVEKTLDLAQATVQPLKTRKRPDASTEELLIDAYNDALVITELYSLLKQCTDPMYHREDDEMVKKLRDYRKKLNFPEYSKKPVE